MAGCICPISRIRPIRSPAAGACRANRLRRAEISGRTAGTQYTEMRRKPMRPVALLCGLSLAALCGAAQPHYDPAKTRVVLVPLLNLSGEKWEDLKQRQVDKGNGYLREAFSARGFQAIDPSLLASKMEQLQIDLTDEEQQKRAILYEIGRAVGADLIVCALITDTDQSLHRFLEIDDSALMCSISPDGILPSVADVGRRLLDPLLPARREGKAKIKLWLLYVKREKPILSAKTAEGRSAGGYFGFFDKGSKQQVIAVANALGELLKGFLKDYPEPARERH